MDILNNYSGLALETHEVRNKGFDTQDFFGMHCI